MEAMGKEAGRKSITLNLEPYVLRVFCFLQAVESAFSDLKLRCYLPEASIK